MNVAETLIVFAGIPLAIVAVMAALIYLPGGRKRSRYRSGQPWDHAPVWYEPHPDHGSAVDRGTPGHDGQTSAIGSSVYGEPTGDSSPGPRRAISGATPAVDAGPLGGARGTW